MSQPPSHRRRLRTDCRGVAALEFGIVAATLILLLLGAYDIGSSVYQRTVLAQAVRSAGQYAQSFPSPSSAITTALTSTLPAAWNNVTSSVACTCINGDGSSTSESDCDACPSTTVERLVTITASRSYSPFYFSTITGSSATYVARIQ